MPHDPKLAPFGLKWNPFSQEVPTTACLKTAPVETFLWRVENLAREGGFALITGEPGTGKSVALRLLRSRLERQPDVVTGVLTRPQSSVADFYRELGALFAVELSPHNRWAGARVLRGRWQDHIEGALFRPVLLIDEAQEMHRIVLNELRLLSAAELDCRSLLTVVLCGDDRLAERLGTLDLRPLLSRLRVRLRLEATGPEQLKAMLLHAVKAAGNPGLLTEGLVQTLAERAAGNPRTLMNLANELLDAAQQRDVERLDEQLFFQVFRVPAPVTAKPRRRRSPKQKSLLP